MSIGLGKGVGIPVKLMHESEGHVITVSTIYILSFCSGSFFPKRGILLNFLSLSLLFFFFLFFFSRDKRCEGKRGRAKGENETGLFDVGDALFFFFFFFIERVFEGMRPPNKNAHADHLLLLIIIIRLN